MGVDSVATLFVKSHSITTPVLYDTGSLTANYGSEALGKRLKQAGAKPLPCNHSVCSVFGDCHLCSTRYRVDMLLVLGVINKIIKIDILIVDLKTHDLIIGRPTLLEHTPLNDSDMLFKHHHCHNNMLRELKQVQAQLPAISPRGNQTPQGESSPLREPLMAQGPIPWESTPSELIVSFGRGGSRVRAPRANPTDGSATLAGIQPSLSPGHELLNSQDPIKQRYERRPSSDYLSSSAGADDVDEHDLPSAFDESLLSTTPGTQGSDEYKLVQLTGTAELQANSLLCLKEFADVFSTTLNRVPANITPYEITLKEDNAWATPKHSTGARLSSPLKQEEIARQVDLLLAAGVIQPSSAPQWSHTVLARKKNNKWRFCIDYRDLNAQSESVGWPLPNIIQTLRDIGAQRPKFFAVLDLTSGYHQMPMSMSSRRLTAFITNRGLYEFTRVPFGLKGAPSYFQSHMANAVLGAVLHNGCEVYLDDIIVFAQSEEELLQNLRRVLQCLRSKGLTANPEKCRIGMQEIEYVGHVINKDGMTFSAEKLEHVLHFPLPTINKELKSFLGLANYFRDHVQGFALLAAPLNDLLHDYKRTRALTIKWDTTSKLAFNAVKEAIYNCPFLYYLDDQREVYLHTDASDYGIGGYLFQYQTIDVDGATQTVEQPVAFCSQALTPSRVSAWSTIEKEAFAIIFSIKKFEPLLRDRKFVLRTDHRNLAFVEKAPSPRVTRWKLLLQEFDFDIEYIKGVDNTIADSLSRDIIRVPPPPAAGAAPTSSLLAVLQPYLAMHLHQHISNVHNSIVGHAGFDRTLARLHAAGHNWRGMRQDVRTFISRCPACQKMSQIKAAIGVPKYTLATQSPMNAVHIDSIGPLPVDQFGNAHILVIVDAFSRFVELFPVQTLETFNAVRPLLNYVGRYGVPSIVRTDNGSQFKDIFHAMLKRLGVRHDTITPHSHEENALVERVNKEVMRHLRPLILDNPTIKDNWSDALPLVQRILNSSVNSSIGVAPATVVFGTGINLDRNLLKTSEPSPLDGITSQSGWVEKMSQLQAEIIHAAQRQQDKTHKEHLFPQEKVPRKPKKVAKPPPLTEFQDRDMVLVAYPDGGLGRRPPHKLLTRLKGPYQVVNHVGSTYTIRNLVTLKTENVFVGQLRPFLYDPNRVIPRHIALQELAMYDIDRIVAHKGDLNGPKSQIFFKVRWAGYSSEEDTWEPWNGVFRTTATATYLASIGRPGLIPKAYRQAPQAEAQAQPTL